jgi:hypothetical protein
MVQVKKILFKLPNKCIDLGKNKDGDVLKFYYFANKDLKN